ncbi:LAFA_0F19042g1_1 [Lachancea sp. 'fantastica']|nr:LAFA_0F19042g1_1 [Lachancea sp. 'fantastica']
MSFQLNFNNNESGKTGSTPVFGNADGSNQKSEGAKPLFGGFGQKPAGQDSQNSGQLFGNSSQKSTASFPTFGTINSSGSGGTGSQPFGSLGSKPGTTGLGATNSSLFNATKPSSDSTPKPTFSFGAQPAAQNTFSFGGSSTADKAGSPFGQGSTSQNAPQKAVSLTSESKKDDKPAFSFGAGNLNSQSHSNETKTPAFQGTGGDTSSKPFSFGTSAGEAASKPLFGGFGSDAQKPSTGNDKSAEKPAFSFNTSQSVDKPAFSFGSGKTLGTAEKKIEAPQVGSGSNNGAASQGLGSGVNSNSKPAFNFGSSASIGTTGEKVDTSKEQTEIQQSEANKPAFSFGANNKDSTNNNNKTGALFSNTAQQDASKNTPLFGSSAGKSEPLTFGKNDEKSIGGKDQDKKESAAEPSAGGLFSTGAGPSKSAAGFGFETKATTKTDSGTSAGAKAPMSFGGLADKKTEKPAVSCLLFGKRPSVDEAKNASSEAGAAASDQKPVLGGFSLGGGDKKAATTKPAFSFGSKNEKEPSKTASTDEDKGVRSSGVSFGNKESEKVDQKGATAPSFAGNQESQKTVDLQPVSLDNKTLDDLVTKWTSQLGGSAEHFSEYSQKVKEWDQVLMLGGEHIGQLYSEMVMAEQTQSRVDQSLQYIERQQSELETFLDNYERKADSLLSGVFSSSSGSSANINDQKRQQVYQTAQALDDNLTSLSSNLSSLITEINGVSETFNKATNMSVTNEDENTQLIKLLNTHLDALKSLDNSSESLESKLRSL